MENLSELGVTVVGQLYRFSRHFLEKMELGDHLEATAEIIALALSEPDHVQPPEGNRTVYWKKILELDYEWWLVVVISAEAGGTQVLTPYDNTDKGARLWGI